MKHWRLIFLELNKSSLITHFIITNISHQHFTVTYFVLLNVPLADLNYNKEIKTIKQIAVNNNYDPEGWTE